MITRPNTNKQRMKRHKRVRAKISGTPVCPRLNVFRSEANIYAQIIDDVNGVTLASASSLDKAIEGYGGNVTAASAVGKLIAERALAKGIENVVFDRGGYLYHGRVQALAEGAREGGLKFYGRRKREKWQDLKENRASISKSSFTSTVFPRPSRAAVS